jgi:hypothetical protein
MSQSIETPEVKIGTEIVRIGDLVGENDVPWIKAEVVEIFAAANRYSGDDVTVVTVKWLKDERHGNLIARKGAERQYTVNRHGVSGIRKVS